MVQSGPLNVRGSANTTGALLGTQGTGAPGSVIGGPVVQGGFTWWNINYDTGVDGWSAEDFLTVSTLPAPTPTPTPNPVPTPPISAGGALIEGFNTTPPTLGVARPGLGVPFTDPVYKTTVTRATDASQITDRNIPSWVRHEYSRKQPFNADGTKVLMMSSNGWFRLYSVNAINNTLTFVKTLAIGEPQEPIWDATDQNIIHYLGYYGEGMTISSYDIRTDQTSVTRNLSTRIKALFGSSAASAWTKQEGRP